MKSNHEQQTKEHKSIKEVVMENRGKIIAGISIIGCGVCCVMLKNKYEKEIKNVTDKFGDKMLKKIEELNHYKTKVLILEDDIIDLYEDNQTLSAILSEGVLQDAITTTSNKINSRTSKLRMYEDRLLNGDLKVEEKIQKIKGDLEILFKRKDLYETKLHQYEIKDLVD